MPKSYFPCFVLYNGENQPILVRSSKEIKAGIPFRVIEYSKVEGFVGVIATILFSSVAVFLIVFLMFKLG